MLTVKKSGTPSQTTFLAEFNYNPYGLQTFTNPSAITKNPSIIISAPKSFKEGQDIYPSTGDVAITEGENIYNSVAIQYMKEGRVLLLNTSDSTILLARGKNIITSTPVYYDSDDEEYVPLFVSGTQFRIFSGTDPASNLGLAYNGDNSALTSLTDQVSLYLLTNTDQAIMKKVNPLSSYTATWNYSALGTPTQQFPNLMKFAIPSGHYHIEFINRMNYYRFIYDRAHSCLPTLETPAIGETWQDANAQWITEYNIILKELAGSIKHLITEVVCAENLGSEE
jgi:hypothetical protein